MRGLLDKSRKCAGGKTNENFCAGNYAFPAQTKHYSLVGAREFVPFDQFEELTVDIIKACEQHFTELKESDDLVCDVLAGEQGPSCRTIGQIPDQKVFHVRFVYANSLGDRSIVKQDACTGVRSACSTIWIFVNYAVYTSGRGRCRDFLVLKWGGGLNLQIWDLNRAHETERTVFPILQVFSMCRRKL